MKWVLKFLSFFRKNRGKIVVGLIFLIITLGVVGLWDSGNKLKTFFDAIAILGLTAPSKINIFTFFAFVLAVILVYGGFLLIAFHNVLNKNLYKLLLKDKNIILFGFGEINKTFLENFNRDENIIVIDKKDEDFEEFWEKGYVYLKREINEDFLNELDFEKTTNIIVALGNDRLNIDVGLKLIDKLKDVKSETKLIIHLNDTQMSDIFVEKLVGNSFIDLKVFSLNSEIVDDLFEKYALKLVPYDYAKLRGNKKELKVAVIGNSGVSIELIKRIFINFIFPNEVKTKIFLIDENEEEFLKRVEFETNYTPDKFPHINLEVKRLDYELLKDRSFWSQDNLIDIFIAFEDENKNLEIAIDMFEKVFVHIDKENLNYPNIFFAMYEELAFSEYIDKNKKNFKNFFTFGNLSEVLKVENLLDDEKFEIAMKIHNTWANEKDIKKAWYSTSPANRFSSMAQYEHIPFKLLSLGFRLSKEKEDKTLEYEKVIKNIDKGNISFEEFLNSGDYFLLCNTEHRRWMAYHFINNWEYDDFEGKEKKELKKSLKLHNCLTEFRNFKDSVKNTFIYDFDAYKKIPEYIKGKYKIVKL